MTKGELCNRALSFIGCKKITSLDGTEKEAVICKQVVDNCIEKILSEHDWCSALSYTTLPRLLKTPPFKYQYVYALPSDYVKLVEISIKDYERCGREIFTNAEKIELKYMKMPSNTETLDIWVEDTIIFYIASEIASPLLGKDKRVELAYNRYKQQLFEAISRDQGEKAEVLNEEEDYTWK